MQRKERQYSVERTQPTCATVPEKETDKSAEERDRQKCRRKRKTKVQKKETDVTAEKRDGHSLRKYIGKKKGLFDLNPGMNCHTPANGLTQTKLSWEL